MRASGAASSATHVPVSRPALLSLSGSAGGGGIPETSEFDGTPRFQGLNEDAESDRLDREEALRVSENQLVSS